MIRKSMPSGFDPMGGCRFSEKIMLHQKSMIRKSIPSGFDPMGGFRFSDKIMLH